MSYNNVLVAVNVYEDYHKILNTAELYVKKFNAQMTILMVLNSPFELVPMAIDYQKALEQEVVATLTREAERIHIKNIKTATAVGTAHDKIAAYAKENDIDLIILGTHGINLLLGSTSNSVLHQASCDVLTVRLRESQLPANNEYKKIIVATDMLEDSEQLADVTNQIAEKFDSEIYAITVQADPTIAASAYGIVPDIYGDLMENAKNKLEQWCKQNQLKANQKCAIGEASYAITDYAQEANTSLIITGSHQRSALGRFFLGSTANAILHHAKQDVLVVRLKHPNQEEQD